MRKLFLYLTTLFCIVSLCSCSDSREETVIQSKQDLLGKKIGVITGTFHDQLVLDSIGQVDLSYFQSVTEIVLALQKEKIDAAIFELINATRFTKKYSDIKILEKILPTVPQAIGLKKGSPLKAELDPIIEQMFNQGFYAKLVEKWISNEESEMPKQDWEGKNGTLVVGTTGAMPPTNFYLNNELAGADMELVLAIGKILDKKIEFVTMDFNSLMPALQTGKIDMCIAGIVITEERSQIIDFTHPYFESAIIAMVKKELSNAKAANSSFFDELKASFHRTFIIESRWKMILNGLGVTLILSILSGIFGILLGFIICLFRRSKLKISSIPSAVFIRIIQGMPILVLLMILYYVIFAHSNISGIIVAIIGFSINFGVYASEIMRSGMDAVDKGQMEAAAALGYNKRQSFFKILLPQAANHFIPVLKGEFISMVKMTSVVGYIAVVDLTKVSDIIRSRTMEAFFPLIATAILYFIIAILLTRILVLIEKKTDPKQRPRKIRRVV